jgi:hypothetical protein
MKKSDEFPPEATPDTEPQVIAIKRQDEVWRMGKRTFLKSTAVAAFASVAAACAGEKKNPPGANANPNPDNDPIPPFGIGGMTYRLIALPDYNATLPAAGRNLAIVASVKDDFYFRAFDDQGTMAVNQHQSKAADQAALAEMKSLAQTVTAKRSADATEQARFAELFATTTGTVKGTGRRIQATDARVDSTGRRVQGSASSGAISGRRIPGAEGRLEARGEPRNLGTLVVDNQRYEESKVAETYTDGYTRIVHTGGETVIRTDALPEIVQMQLPRASTSPSPRPSAIPRTTVVPAPAPTPQTRPSDSYGGSYHYWRPN